MVSGWVWAQPCCISACSVLQDPSLPEGSDDWKRGLKLAAAAEVRGQRLSSERKRQVRRNVVPEALR